MRGARLCAAALALQLGLATSAQAQDSMLRLAELARRCQELGARGASGTSAERGAALVELGPSVLPWLVAELARRPRDETLRQAVRGFGRAALAPWWQAKGAGPRASDAATLVLLAELGDARELDLALFLTRADGELAVQALQGILEREPELPASLAATVLRLETPAATCVVRALGGLASEAALACLGALLVFEDDELELCLLSAVEACGARTHSNEETRREVRERLWSDDEQILRKAASASAALQDDDALERLVGLLEHPTAFVASTALNALRKLSGRSFPADAGTWRRWLERENAWFDERAPFAFAALRMGHREHLIPAARELAQRRLHRRGIAQELVLLLEHEDALVRRAGCEALGWLGLREAVPGLCALLSDESRAVVEGAERALARLGVPASALELAAAERESLAAR